MKNWIEPVDDLVPEDFQSAIGGHPLVARTLVRRGYAQIPAALGFLDPGEYTPVSPFELPGMQKAVERLEAAIRRGERILVWGDFDVDGQTATSLLVSALIQLGADVAYHIPVRDRESHGVTSQVLEKLLQEAGDNPISLLLTCDTGITSHEAVHYAQRQGIDVVITDHHELPDTLPGAYALVNPHFLPIGHLLKTLPGVGVAYKLVEALFTQTGRQDALDSFLDLTALGIVADVAELTGETRFILQRGLVALRNTQRIGLQMLMETAELDPSRVTEEHIGFVIGPRLNALGRLDDANQAVEFLTTPDTSRARILANHLEGLNAKRQLLTNQVFHGALAQIERDPSIIREPVLILDNPAWHPGVIGIVASHLVERYGRPVILISAPSGEISRASARSVEGVDITKAIAEQRSLLAGFGGHAMAAGFGIDPQNIPEFRRRLLRSLNQAGKIIENSLAIDAYCALSELTIDFVSDLERLAPFGNGNPHLTFADRNVQLVNRTAVGRNKEHLMLTIEDQQGISTKVIWWNGGDADSTGNLPDGRFDLAYTVRTTTYRGQIGLQIQWLDYRLCKEVTSTSTTRPIEVFDYRQVPVALHILGQLGGEETLQIWAEGNSAKILSQAGLPTGQYLIRGRVELEPAEVLVIWTIPPGRAELDEVIAQVKPGKAIIFAETPEAEGLNAFLARLSGLVKWSLQSHAGQISLRKLASAMAHRVSTVRSGLEWMASRGYIRIIKIQGDQVIIAGDGTFDSGHEDIQKKLSKMLQETAAYRSYFARADKNQLF